MPLHYYHSLISDTFRIRDLMNYPFRRVTTRNLRVRYTDLGALIAAAKCLDKSIQLRLTVTDDFMRIADANRPESRRDT
jgi:uncharacterized protein YaeQ